MVAPIRPKSVIIQIAAANPCKTRLNQVERMPAAPKRFSKAEVQSLYIRLQNAIEEKRMTENVRKKFESDLDFYQNEIMEWKVGSAGAFQLQSDEEPVASDNIDATTSIQLKWTVANSKTSQSLLENIQKSIQRKISVSNSEWSQLVAAHFRFWAIYARRPYDSRPAPQTPTKQRPAAEEQGGSGEAPAAATGEAPAQPSARPSEPSARQILGAAGNIRVLEGGISSEDLRAFLEKNPEMAEDLAKVATNFTAPKASARLPAKPQAPKRKDGAPGARIASPCIESAEARELLVDDAEEVLYAEAPGPKRRRKRRSLPRTPRPDGGGGGDDDDDQEEEQEQTPRRQYRGVDSENPFVREFPGCRSKNNRPGELSLGESVAVAAYVLHGADQRDDKRDVTAHENEVRSCCMYSACSVHVHYSVFCMLSSWFKLCSLFSFLHVQFMV